MRESDLEKQLVRKVKSKGGLCMKFVSPGLRGVPDRVILFPVNKVVFVEMKAPKGKLRKQQILRLNQFTDLGAICYVIDSEEKIDILIEELETWNLKHMYTKREL